VGQLRCKNEVEEIANVPVPEAGQLVIEDGDASYVEKWWSIFPGADCLSRCIRDGFLARPETRYEAAKD
jgi:hypothetical protein